MAKMKYALAALVIAATVVLTTSFGAKDWEYKIVGGEPDLCEQRVNELARKGWEAVGLGAGGAMVLQGVNNSATNHGGRVYVLMRHRR